MIGTVRGIITLLLMLLFIAFTWWAFGKRRKSTFDALARVPLEDESNQVSRNSQS
ncbi:MAG: CcoQ/FixQ family Cbb3-type cytochrome c oxidase assembly chaperone [Steroidobacteraceae bacterium]